MSWNLASAWEAVARTCPDAPATCFADQWLTWREFDARAESLAGALWELGARPNSKVALYQYNSHRYLESTFAAFKISAVPVNVNYRYTAAELHYLLDNSDTEVIVVEEGFLGVLAEVIPQLPGLRGVIVIGEHAELSVLDTLAYEAAATGSLRAPEVERSLEDLWFLYTGGTTGMPKGVMWPHRSLIGATAPTFKPFGLAAPSSIEEVVAAAERIHAEYQPVRILPAAPLMHGTSAITTWGVLLSAGSVVTVRNEHLVPADIVRAIDRHAVTNLTIVGDVFARPILEEIERAQREGEPYDLSSLRLVISSGVMWSRAIKERLIAATGATCADLLGSSEGTGFAQSVTTARRHTDTATFRLGPHAAVFSEDGRRVVPGSGERGMLAVGGALPIGYYKDPEKSERTFPLIDGQRWSVPGDMATVAEDGTITLLGRGSVCINTGGEKVFPEEVEEAIKSLPAVLDCNVVGVPDSRWGSAVTAVVAAEPDFDSESAHTQLRSVLAGYKLPKHWVIVDHVLRGPNGKADYRWAARVAQASVGTGQDVGSNP